MCALMIFFRFFDIFGMPTYKWLRFPILQQLKTLETVGKTCSITEVEIEALKYRKVEDTILVEFDRSLKNGRTFS